MSADPQLEREIVQLAQRAREASRTLAGLGSAPKNAWLLRAAERIEAARAGILAANRRDLEAAGAKGLTGPLVKRLELAGGRFEDMLAGLREVAALGDPVGEVTRSVVRPNGLRVGRMRIPLGVVGIIYESRPNVTVDAAALCVKAGNAVILRGGSEAIHSNLALAAELRGAARDSGLPEDAVGIVPHTDRAAIDVLLKQDRSVDLIIPRGGPALIQKVVRESTHPRDQARRRCLSRLPRRERRRRDGRGHRRRLEGPPGGRLQRRSRPCSCTAPPRER